MQQMIKLRVICRQWNDVCQEHTQVQARFPQKLEFNAQLYILAAHSGLWIYGKAGDRGRVDPSAPALQTRLSAKLQSLVRTDRKFLPVLTDFSAQLSSFHQKNNGLLKSIDTTKIKYVNNFLSKSSELLLCSL